ncbi:MAG: type II toxin-antitoxin system RelE/ParE family toxin [Gemmatimonadaceae bacterium]|nr:type II toxin-antitoxin system RelE/ParE family toxin [Gemmatimonadaceae bacterium]
MWRVVQTEEFGDWFNSLDVSAQEDILVAVRVLSEFGPTLGRPQVDTLKGSKHKNMKELRVQSRGRPFRIFFAFDPSRRAVLLVGGNKQGKSRFYETLLPQADKLFDEYLEDTKHERPKRK